MSSSLLVKTLSLLVAAAAAAVATTHAQQQSHYDLVQNSNGDIFAEVTNDDGDVATIRCNVLSEIVPAVMTNYETDSFFICKDSDIGYHLKIKAKKPDDDDEDETQQWMYEDVEGNLQPVLEQSEPEKEKEEEESVEEEKDVQVSSPADDEDVGPVIYRVFETLEGDLYAQVADENGDYTTNTVPCILEASNRSLVCANDKYSFKIEVHVSTSKKNDYQSEWVYKDAMGYDQRAELQQQQGGQLTAAGAGLENEEGQVNEKALSSDSVIYRVFETLEGDLYAQVADDSGVYKTAVPCILEASNRSLLCANDSYDLKIDVRVSTDKKSDFQSDWIYKDAMGYDQRVELQQGQLTAQQPLDQFPKSDEIEKPLNELDVEKSSSSKGLSGIAASMVGLFLFCVLVCGITGLAAWLYQRSSKDRELMDDSAYIMKHDIHEAHVFESEHADEDFDDVEEEDNVDDFPTFEESVNQYRDYPDEESQSDEEEDSVSSSHEGCASFSIV